MMCWHASCSRSPCLAWLACGTLLLELTLAFGLAATVPMKMCDNGAAGKEGQALQQLGSENSCGAWIPGHPLGNASVLDTPRYVLSLFLFSYSLFFKS